jgi:hypothetical protein
MAKNKLSSEEIKSQVEERVRSKQEGKEFKDTSVVDFTRKYQAQYDIITTGDLSDIEKDPVTAYKLIDKSKIWPAYNIEDQRSKGFSSGIVYIKVKIRESLSSKPEDSPEARRLYVESISELQQELELIKDFPFIKDYLYSFYKKWGKVITDALVDKTRFSYVSSDFVYDKTVEKIWSKRFINQITFKSDSARQIFLEANLFSPLSKEQEFFIIESKKQKHRDSIEKYKSQIKEAEQAKDLAQLEKAKGFLYHEINRKDPLEDQRERLIYRINQFIQAAEKSLEVVKLQPFEMERKENWSWADPKQKTIASHSGKEVRYDNILQEYGIELKKNKPEPLKYIKRTGGLEIPEISVENIIKYFGYKDVVFGNYVKDKESKEHVRHFLGAMLDLAEILNVDIKQINQLGELSIFFGALGCGSFSTAMACYYPARKAINLTKKTGDGTLAHEWSHYLDNILGEGTIQKATGQGWATNVKDFYRDPDGKVKRAFYALMNFIMKGNGVPFEVKVKIGKFHKEGYPRFKVYGETLEEAIKGVQEKFPRYAKYEDLLTEKGIYDYYKYLATKFDKEKIVVPMKVTSSRYYFVSSQYDSGETSKYFSSPKELFARAFETYIEKKLERSERHSNYLVSIEGNLGIMALMIPKEEWPYAYGNEADRIVDLMDNVISAIKEVHDIKDFSWYTDNRQDEYIQLENSENEKVDTGVIVKKEVEKTEVKPAEKTSKDIKVVKEKESSNMEKSEVQDESRVHKETFEKIEKGEIKTPEDLGKSIVEDHKKEEEGCGCEHNPETTEAKIEIPTNTMRIESYINESGIPAGREVTYVQFAKNPPSVLGNYILIDTKK